MNAIKGFKTLGFGLLVAIVGVIQTFNFATIVPQDKTWSGAVMLAIGAIIVALRYVTDTGIGKSS